MVSLAKSAYMCMYPCVAGDDTDRLRCVPDMNQRKFLYVYVWEGSCIGYSRLFFISLKWEVWIFSLLLKFYRHFFLFLSLTRLPSEKDSDKLNISLEKILMCRCILILDSHDWFNLIFWRTKSSHELIHLNNESFDIIHQFSIESS